VILVVDSTDHERLHLAKLEVHKMMNNEVINFNILIYLNIFSNKKEIIIYSNI